LQRLLNMQPNKINILSTRSISDEFVEQAADSGINLEIVPLIETEPIQTIEVQQEIEYALLQTATVVFTSGNAVEAVATELEGHQPDWEIFCLGNTTRELVSKYFGSEYIVGVADNASELAELIVESAAAQEVIFFCGDQRRAELPEKLHQSGIEVEEIVVYHTIPVPRKIKKDYDAILFFSPSAVKSFFELNTGGEKTIFFAIGNTTAGEIKKYTKNKILTSAEPSKEKLVEMVLEYFT
jgi:uroporphyrinogen-III synthase